MRFKDWIQTEAMTSTNCVAGFSRIAIPLVFRQWPPAIAADLEWGRKDKKKKKVKPQPQVKESFFFEMTEDEFAFKAQEFMHFLTSIFTKKKVKIFGDGLSGVTKHGLTGVTSMGNRWIDFTLNRGFDRSTNTYKPYLSLNFQWDLTGKSGAIPDKMQGDTVQPGSMQFAHALKKLVKWVSQNGIGISYVAEPDRFASYGRMLNTMGFKQSKISGDENDYMRSAKWTPGSDI